MNAAEIDALNMLSERVQVLAEKYKPYTTRDPNIQVYNALTLAKDQLDFAAHLLHKRQPDPRQMTLDTVMITVGLCERCGNPEVSCTCPS